MKASWLASRGVLVFRLVNSDVLKTLNRVVVPKTSFYNN
jgi:very-short-patch-repair endonuclease